MTCKHLLMEASVDTEEYKQREEKTVSGQKALFLGNASEEIVRLESDEQKHKIDNLLRISK